MGTHKRKVTKAQVLILLIIAAAALLAVIGLAAAGLIHLLRSESEPADVTPTVSTSASTAATTAATSAKAATTAASTSAPTAPATSGHYVQPAGAVWYLRLANDWNTLSDDYDQSFTAVEYGGGLSGKLFDSRAVDALREMLAAGNAADPSLKLQPVSCYRSVALQRSLYERQVQKQLDLGYAQAEAERIAATVVKRPGQSEHNTGLAADVGGSGDYTLEQSFEKTAAFRWLTAHCAEYGFVLRFPKDKEDITGVIYEPWHFRYVGREAAQVMRQNNWCLEEYLERTGQ